MLSAAVGILNPKKPPEWAPVPAAGYRPEIDGLRAIAVVAVVLYHAGLGASGGFVGVDVFFVISGFLITSLILKELEARTFTLAGFWERRIRRIFPALSCCVFCTLLIGWLVLLPQDFAELGRSAFFQSLCLANFYFWRSSGYFAGIAEEKPLLHTWSLAVEEQFYLIFPLAMVSLFAIPGLRSRSALLILFGLGILAGLGISVLGVIYRPDAAFYLLPTRAWELLLGAWVALLPTPDSAAGATQASPLARTTAVRELLSIVALLGILLPCWIYTSATPFPGLNAVAPCISTALFIWITGYLPPKSRGPLVARLLCARPVVFVGLISYSLYLWHWPLFAFSKYVSIEPLSVADRCGLVAAGFVLAILSWRLIELPFRARRLCASRPSMFALGAVTTGLIATFGLAIQFQIIPQRFTPEALMFAKGQTDSAFLQELQIADVVAGKLTPIGVSTPNAPIDCLVWGDSHAMAATPAFDQYLKQRSLAGQVAAHSDTAPLLGYFKGPQFGMGRDSLKFNAAVLEHIKRLAIPNVVLVCSWSSYELASAAHPDSRAFEDSLVATVQAIRDAGAKPWIMLQVPAPGFNVPRVLAFYAMARRPIEPLCVKPNPESYAIIQTSGLVERLQAAGATLLDPRPYCLNEEGTHYRVAQGGKPLYRDSGHLSTHGASVVLLPLLEEALPANLPSDTDDSFLPK